MEDPARREGGTVSRNPSGVQPRTRWNPGPGGPRWRAVRIATFNINGVNRRLPNLLAWLEQARPDVVCLQELKAAQAEFPEDAIRAAG